MGPQLDSCGRVFVYPDAGPYVGLQWGRNLIVAEGIRAAGRRLAEHDASMGPQLDSCGRPPQGRARPDQRRFNGAAT